jgi:hypothetical protein
MLVLASTIPPGPVRAATTFVVLQMNLCNSGVGNAPCYASGRSVDEAVTKIHRYPPELVTLQEICRDDLFTPNGWGKLARAMADLYGDAHVSVDFVPAMNSDTGDAYRCRDGEPFGNALMHHDSGGESHRGWYASQDASGEIRAWTCTTVIAGRLTGCTTHLSTEPDVAVRQCRELVSILASPWVLPEVLVGGDFNLRAEPGEPYDVQGCTPPGYDRRGDGALQQVFFTGNVQWVRGRDESMRWTDHPLLYERFRV